MSKAFLDEIGFNSLYESKGGTYTFAFLTHVDAKNSPIMVSTTNLPEFQYGYFVTHHAIDVYSDEDFTQDRINKNIELYLSHGLLFAALQFLGFWFDPELQSWFVDASIWFEDKTDAYKFAKSHGETAIWDNKNYCNIYVL